jgi:hypothetical protein
MIYLIINVERLKRITDDSSIVVSCYLFYTLLSFFVCFYMQDDIFVIHI